MAHKSKGQPSCLMQDSALVTSTKGNVLDRYLVSAYYGVSEYFVLKSPIGIINKVCNTMYV